VRGQAAVTSVSDVAVTKVPNPSSVNVGKEVTYTIRVTNRGPATAANVMLVDPIPAKETFVSVDNASCSGTSVVTCHFGSLAPGASRVVRIVTRGESPGTATNVATVSTSSPESNTANNQARASVPIKGVFTPPAVQCVQLALQHKKVIVGGQTTLLVRVHPRGASAAVRGARVEVLGPGIHIVKATNASGQAQITVTPLKVGVLRVRLVDTVASCPRSLADVTVQGASRAPNLTG